MFTQILADYYEERSFVSKAIRLRNHKSVVIWGFLDQYKKPCQYHFINIYAYEHSLKGNCYYYGNGCGYHYYDMHLKRAICEH